MPQIKKKKERKTKKRAKVRASTFSTLYLNSYEIKVSVKVRTSLFCVTKKPMTYLFNGYKPWHVSRINLYSRVCNMSPLPLTPSRQFFIVFHGPYTVYVCMYVIQPHLKATQWKTKRNDHSSFFFVFIFIFFVSYIPLPSPIKYYVLSML